jgi:PAS domain S-box-containing protein
LAPDAIYATIPEKPVGEVMLRDYQLQQRDYDYLLRISRAMTSQLELNAVLRIILESATRLVGGQVGLIALVQADGTYKVHASYGIPSQMIPMVRPLLADLPESSAHLDPLHWVIPDLERRLNVVAQAIGMALRQVVALPLMVGDVVVGVIYILRQEDSAFTFVERRVLSSFAGQAAIAVHNARLYHEVRREKQRLDAIIENSGDGVMILDPEQRITVFNRALTIMTGIPAEEAIGQYCWQVLVLHDHSTNEEKPELSHPLDHCQRGERYYVEGDYFREDGSRITLGITYSPLLDSDGQLVNIIANVRDITHFREAEEMKSTFISVISHELKTPVALIKGFAGTLRREDAHWDEATMRESLAVIEDESDRLTQLIDNLLDASRLQAGQMRLDKTDVPIDKMAAHIVNEFRTQTNKHIFVLDFPDDFPPVQGDEERLRQVLNNLISNAIKYSPDGGQITVSGRADQGQVYVAVTDQGIGIPAGERERIFDRFYRVESPLSRRTQGAGLGLFLVKSVVEAHGGYIWVESNQGQGSTFVFTLPREG